MKTKLFLNNNISRLQVVVLAGFLLSACGQKGPLYLPKNQPPQATPSKASPQQSTPKSQSDSVKREP